MSVSPCIPHPPAGIAARPLTPVDAASVHAKPTAFSARRVLVGIAASPSATALVRAASDLADGARKIVAAVKGEPVHA